MNYLEKMDHFWREPHLVKEKNVAFQNSFDYSIFNLVYRFLDSSSNGPSFIEVPSKELGSVDFSKNYENFCSAVLTAAVVFALEPKRAQVLPNEEVILGDYYFSSRGKVMKVVDKNRGKEVSAIGQMGSPSYTVPLRTIKLLQEFGYNSENGQTFMDEYLDWLKNSMKIDPVNVFISTYKILIVSHELIERTEISRIIPHCTIKENGSLNYSSPVPPFIYFARDHATPKVKELVQQKFFDAVIMLGDSKISSSDVWSLANNYFKKAIYIGKNSPYALDAYNDLELSRRHYSFSLNEMHQYYGVREQILFEQKTIKNAELDDLIQAFFGKLEKVDPELKFDLSLFKDLTARISESQKDWFLDFFDQKIITEGNYELDYSELKEKFQDILEFLERKGNASKIEAFKEINHQAGRKTEVIAVVLNKFEIENLAAQLEISESKILTVKNFGRKLRARDTGILESGRNKIFIFFSLPYVYDGSIIHVLDRFNVTGRRVFLTFSKKDPRFSKIFDGRNSFNRSKLQNPVREEISRIPFDGQGIFDEIDQRVALSSISDLMSDEYANFSFRRRTQQRQYYNVQIQGYDGNFYLAGKVVDADEVELVDLSEINVRDRIIFYRHHSDSFDKIWEMMYPGFSEDIQKYSEIMKEIIKTILSYYKNKVDKLYQKLQSLGLKTSKNSIKRLANDDDNTLFPRLDTLWVLKSFCEQTEDFKNHLFVKEFQMILKAKKGVELKKKLGNRLSNSLLDKYCGFEIEDFELDKLFKENPDLLASSLASSIILGEIKNIKKI